MSIQSEISRITKNVNETLSTIRDTGVTVGNGSDALPSAAAALANEKQDKASAVSIEGSANIVMDSELGPGPYKIEMDQTEDGPIPASEISYDNAKTGMTATTAQDAVDELFQSVSDGKSKIAAAVTDKGVQTAATDSFSTMAGKIGQIETGIKLPTLTNPATVSDIAQGKQLINQNGEIVTGNIETYTNSSIKHTADSSYASGDKLEFYYHFPRDMLYRQNCPFFIDIPLTNFGNATAADVVAGKTFTSAAGVNVTGIGAFMKVHLVTVNSMGGSATLVRNLLIPFPGTSIPRIIVVYNSTSFSFTNSALDILVIMGSTGAYAGRNIKGVLDYNDFSYGSFQLDKISLVVEGGFLNLMLPDTGSSTPYNFDAQANYNVFIAYN